MEDGEWIGQQSGRCAGTPSLSVAAGENAAAPGLAQKVPSVRRGEPLSALDEVAAALPGVRTALSAGPRGPARSAGVAGPGGVPDPVHRAVLLPAVASGPVDVPGGGRGDDLPDGLHHAEPERREPRV